MVTMGGNSHDIGLEMVVSTVMRPKLPSHSPKTALSYCNRIDQCFKPVRLLYPEISPHEEDVLSMRVM
nr:hypothetical protein CFP56_66489 [Quercus suber]